MNKSKIVLKKKYSREYKSRKKFLISDEVLKVSKCISIYQIIISTKKLIISTKNIVLNNKKIFSREYR